MGKSADGGDLSFVSGKRASPRSLALPLGWPLLAATWSVQIVPSPFISAARAENLRGRDKIHSRRVGADCLEQVL